MSSIPLLSVQSSGLPHSSICTTSLYSTCQCGFPIFFPTSHSSHPVECTHVTAAAIQQHSSLSLSYTGCCTHLWTWHSIPRGSQSLLTLLSIISRMAELLALQENHYSFFPASTQVPQEHSSPGLLIFLSHFTRLLHVLIIHLPFLHFALITSAPSALSFYPDLVVGV